ncbi:acyltransferase family protein [Amycolatopsis anabasis]|uniref:acyltransferase family protein n=1 Tax=Amycolatopsis anabasis TaxID=1840409 RepID=UPI00131AA97D|nr:acyltransferase family protein [Amycolatopsis anabasis]
MAQRHAGTAPRARTTTSPGHRTNAARKYRPELQGLRALAVLLVVVYHVWLGRISGGVDVFFLISGFLITGQLVRASTRGRIAFRPLWGRMIKRLFPAALTVLAAVIAISVLVLPENRWFQTIKEVVASALYVENWRLAADSVDYFTQHDSASVAQHFWSLSIQGQFYLVWPLLVALVALAARLTRQSLRPMLSITLLVLFTASLTYSVWLTAANQPLAYFHSLTRVWEFALGGLLVLAIDAVTVSRWLRIVLGWAGIAALISCGLVLQVGQVFPGYLALWPTLAAALVITAGATGSRLGADRLLASRPLVYLGNLSYALYLWHWPVLIFYLVARDRATVGLRGGAIIIAASLLLAAATYHLVEKPARDSRIGQRTNWGAYRFGVAMLVPVLVAAGAWQVVSMRKAESYAASVNDPDHPGALARTAGFERWASPNAPLAPSFVALPEDFARIDEEHCTTAARSADLEVCATETNGPPARRIVVTGDSHAGQFIGALRPIAERRNWQIIAMLRGGCPFSTDSETVPGDQPCIDWNNNVAEEILEQRPDAVFTIATKDVRPGATEHLPPGFVNQWRKVDAAGIPVLAVRDNPRFDDYSPPLCVEANGPTAPECSRPRAELYAPEPPYAGLPDLPPNVSFLDFSDYFCEQDTCPPVIGNVLVYMDNNHISATYMTTLSTILENAVDSALGWHDDVANAPT